MFHSNFIIGPGSGQEMSCRFCGYRGNSYYHMICPGGHCFLCNKGGSKTICPFCNRIVCETHSVFDTWLEESICLKCHAEKLGVEYKEPEKEEKDPNCQCEGCGWKRQFSEFKGKLSPKIIKTLDELRDTRR